MHRLNRVLLCAGIFSAGIFMSCGPALAEKSKTFENKLLHYSVKYPGNYQIKPLGRVIVFISPVEDKKTGFKDNINIAAEPLSSPGMKLEEFFNQGKKNLTLGGSEIKILEEKKEKLGGAEAYRISYISKQKKTNFKLMQVVSIHKDKAFVVTYTALAEQFDRGLAQADSIIKSLRFTD